jgi:hypothetical protein
MDSQPKSERLCGDLSRGKKDDESADTKAVIYSVRFSTCGRARKPLRITEKSGENLDEPVVKE